MLRTGIAANSTAMSRRILFSGESTLSLDETFLARVESEGTTEISNAAYQNKSKVVVRLPGSSVVEHAAVKRELQIH